MTEGSYRLHVSTEQQLVERIHVNLQSPVVVGTVRTQSRLLKLLGAILLLLGLLLLLLVVDIVPVGRPDTTADSFMGALGVASGALTFAAGFLLPAYYRATVKRLEGKIWAYFEPGVMTVDFSPAGIAIAAAYREDRIGWGYFDDAAIVATGLELRRRGAPVGFYPAEAFGSPAHLQAVGEQVRGWIATAPR